MEENLEQQPADCIKIVLFGPESTGKSTLCEKLAKYYNTVCASEYMREYLQEKWDTEKKVCEVNDILPIARGQMRNENTQAKNANKILFCDTDLLEIKVYSEAYYDGYCPPLLLKPALNNWYDLYFLTNIDTPWIPDDLRDKPLDREGMFQKFKSALQENQRPFIILSGDENERFVTAITAINELIGK